MCPICGSDVHIHRPTQTWGCSNLECKAEGTVEQLGRSWLDDHQRWYTP